MPKILKSKALRAGDAIRILSLASPVREDRIVIGCDELVQLGYKPVYDREQVFSHDSFFAGSAESRTTALERAFAETETRAIFCGRGGYGSNYVVDLLKVPESPKLFLGFSDLTALQIFLWQEHNWVTLYGPLVAGGFHCGANSPEGYDGESFHHAVSGNAKHWQICLAGDVLTSGFAEGTILGGCLTLIETSIGTPWELDTRESILFLEDRGMKPYQVDRSLRHLLQAGKFERVRGIILGDFPDCDVEGVEWVHNIAARILTPLRIPVVYGAPIGHTKRAMLTIPIGVQGRLHAEGSGTLEILEPAVVA